MALKKMEPCSRLQVKTFEKREKISFAKFHTQQFYDLTSFFLCQETLPFYSCSRHRALMFAELDAFPFLSEKSGQKSPPVSLL